MRPCCRRVARDVELVEAVRDGIGPAPAAYAVGGDRRHYLHALWRPAARPFLIRGMSAGTLALRRLHGLLGSTAVTVPAAAPGDFVNFNAPDLLDRPEIRRRLAALDPRRNRD